MADVQRAGIEHTARRLTLAIAVGGTGLGLVCSPACRQSS